METTTIRGRVAQVNDKGLKLDGADQWANVSKFAVGVVMPTRGQHVTLTLDGKGFIRGIALATTNGHQAPALVAPVQPAQPPAASVVAPAAATKPAAPDWPLPWEGDADQQPGTERRISRQAVLNTATAILGSGGRAIADPGEVVGLAAQLEKWVYRPAKKLAPGTTTPAALPPGRAVSSLCPAPSLVYRQTAPTRARGNGRCP